MRRLFLVTILMCAMVLSGASARPAATLAAQPASTAPAGGTEMPDPRADAAAALQAALRFARTTPPTAGPLQDSRTIAPKERQYLPSGVHLQNFIAQYSFVIPASDNWMLGFTFWDDGQGNSWDLSAIGSPSDLIWALGHSMANQWQAEQVMAHVANAQQLGLAPGTQANWTLVVYNGVAIVADSGGTILGTVDIGKTSIGDVTVKMGWVPVNGDSAASVTMAISDFQVWDLSSLPSMAEPVESFPAAGSAVSPVLPPAQQASTLGMVFEHERSVAIGNPPLAAGNYGFMTQASGNQYTFQSVKANVSDFYSIVTYTNPDDASVPFDIGIGFRLDVNGNVGYVISIRSDGTWVLDGFLGGQGTVSGLNQEPGASNTLELLVQGGTAVFALNGIVQTQFDVSQVARPGNIYLFTGWVPGNSVDGRRVSYQDWWVFPVSA